MAHITRHNPAAVHAPSSGYNGKWLLEIKAIAAE